MADDNGPSRYPSDPRGGEGGSKNFIFKRAMDGQLSFPGSKAEDLQKQFGAGWCGTCGCFPCSCAGGGYEDI